MLPLEKPLTDEGTYFILHSRRGSINYTQIKKVQLVLY